MKNLKSLSHSDLISKTKALVSEARRLGTEILHHLREIESRKLYLERYSSLHEFVVKELHYSDGAAFRRIQAMRLIRELPQVEEALQSGEVSLSTASQLQNFFRAEKKRAEQNREPSYTQAEKLELFKQIKTKSTRETEAFLAAQ